MSNSNTIADGYTPSFLDNEIWDYCLECGLQWVGIIGPCRCDSKAGRVKSVGPVISPVMTKNERIALGRRLIAKGEGCVK